MNDIHTHTRSAPAGRRFIGRLAGAAVAGALLIGAPALATLMAPTAIAIPDSDGDRLLDDAETPGRLGTLPFDSDSDEDRLSDGREALDLGTNPLKQDTDGDGINDGTEVEWQMAGNRNTNPREPDSDFDGVRDWDEIVAGTDPGVPNNVPVDPVDPGQQQRPDTDGDGMFDEDETNGWNSTGHVTDPNDPDTDNDDVNDGAEDDKGTDPTNPNDK